MPKKPNLSPEEKEAKRLVLEASRKIRDEKRAERNAKRQEQKEKEELFIKEAEKQEAKLLEVRRQEEEKRKARIAEEDRRLAALAPLPPLSEEDAEQEIIESARNDFVVFCEYVGKDEETGQDIILAPIHKSWRHLIEKHPDVLIWSHRRSGKTTILSILRTLWELGRNPKLRFLILSETSEVAIRILRSISQYIKDSEELHRVFPDLKPDPNGPWTTTEINVAKKVKVPAKDPSVRAVGVRGALASGRVDRLVIDDILTMENTRTEHARKLLSDWYKNIVVGMLTRNHRRLVVGTAFHPEDLLHTFAKEEGVLVRRFPIINSKGVVTWPEQFPPDVIKKLRISSGPLAFARQFLCLARDDGQARFHQEWIDAALKRGEGLKFVYELKEIPAGCYVFVGVDLAFSKGHKSDETVFFTFMQDETGDRRLLYIESGKWTTPTIVQKCFSHAERYLDPLIVVENNGAQAAIRQFANEIGNLQIVPHTTTKAKHDPVHGTEGFANEIHNGKWIFPNEGEGKPKEPELDKLIQEMLFFDPKGHTGDRLMACYFARDQARLKLGAIGGNGTAIGMRVISADDGEVSSSPSKNDVGLPVAEKRSSLGPLAQLLTPPEPEEGAEVVDEWTARERIRNGYVAPKDRPKSATAASNPEDGSVLTRLFDVG